MSVPERPDHPMTVPIHDDHRALPTHRGYAAAVRGILHLALGDTQQAGSYLGQAVRTSPETALPRVGRALVYMADGRTEPAYAELRTAAILEPTNFQVQHLAGEAAFHTGRFREASEAFGAALSLDAKEPILRALAFYCRARAYRKLGQTGEAIQCYLEAQRLYPEHAPSFFGCGVALQEAGKPEEALRHYQRCVDLSPRHARALMGMGNCLEVTGRAPEAVEAYRAALRADPEYAPPRYSLAVLVERTADPDEVAALLRGYLDRAPDADNAADARRRLALAQLRASGHVAAASATPEDAGETPFLDSSQDDALFNGQPTPAPVDPRVRT
jgi:tetratricopeptide (TPR) repeat protein